MRWQIAIGRCSFVAASAEFCLAADPRYPDWPCAQAKVPEISLAAVWAGPPLDDVADKWKDDAKVSALVPKLAARRTPLEEAQKAITEFLAGSAADKATAGKLLFAGLFDTPQCPALVGPERARTGDPQAARGRGQDPRRYARAAGAAGCIPARSAQDRRTRQSTGLGNADFRGPAACDQIRLRGAHRDRPAVVRARSRDPAGDGIANAVTDAVAPMPAQLLLAGRGSGCASATGRLARSQPSVPSGYQATLG